MQFCTSRSVLWQKSEVVLVLCDAVIFVMYAEHNSIHLTVINRPVWKDYSIFRMFCFCKTYFRMNTDQTTETHNCQDKHECILSLSWLFAYLTVVLFCFVLNNWRIPNCFQWPILLLENFPGNKIAFRLVRLLVDCFKTIVTLSTSKQTALV